MACNRFDGQDKVGIPEVNKCLLDMATAHYWPLMEEVAPKLGVYEPLVEPAREVMEIIVEHTSRSVRDGRPVAPDRALIHRQIVGQYTKIFEILEYLGFLSRREASRALKSGGRGPVFAINLCNLLDSVPSKRLTFEMIDQWIGALPEPAEFHVSGQAFHSVQLPPLPVEHGLAILDKSVTVLGKSAAYPYGFTDNLIERLTAAGIATVGQLATTDDQTLDQIDYIGDVTIKRIREVVYQAIWM